MADIFQEVDEALQQERIQAFWHRWAPWLIAGAVAVVLITAAVVLYKDMREQKLTQATQQLMQARNADKPGEALSTFAGEAANPHKTYARLLAAGNALEADDMQRAVNLYDDIIADASAPGELRDLARVMAVRAGLDNDKTRSESGAEALLDQLNPVIDNSDSPWHPHARFQAAAVHGQLKGAYDKADSILSKLINDQETPRSLVQRARRLKHVFAVRAAQRSGDGV
jgi:hypothetical protein